LFQQCDCVVSLALDNCSSSRFPLTLVVSAPAIWNSLSIAGTGRQNLLSVLTEIEREEASTNKSVETHAGTVSMPRVLDLQPFDP